MAQLIHMRQRIKAVETIKKITHAMRLISMSTHSRLRAKKEQFQLYKESLFSFSRLMHSPDEQQVVTSSQELIILVGSQKGLCGVFNSQIFRFFETNHINLDDTDMITVGKHATDYITSRIKPLMTFDQFTSQEFVAIATTIADYISKNKNRYLQVTVYSNYGKTFFVQKPQKTILFPAAKLLETTSAAQTENEPYQYENDPTQLAQTIHHMLLTVWLEELLFDSLLAEQAARFLSMDGSTRNAENLLNQMKLEYNKTRQAAITRELTELSSSLQ